MNAAMFASRPKSYTPLVAPTALRSAGRPLDDATRAYMEPRFGHDFGRVRIHTDEYAFESARALRANAYTVGTNVVFAQGRYAPDTTTGKRLLAHELAHVIQQEGALTRKPGLGQTTDPLEREAEAAAQVLIGLQPSVAQRSHQPLVVPTGVAPSLQRDEDEESGSIQGQDPSFLVCLALCELGIPPATWRVITRMFLEAVWEEYRQQYSQAQASQEFQNFHTAFRLYSPLRVAKLVLTFVVQGKVGLVPLRTAGASVARSRLQAMLIARGATEAGIVAAEQIVRRVALVIELAIAAGCLAYCGATAYARTITEVSQAVAAGLADAANMLGLIGQGAGQLLTQIFVRPVLIARATIDPSNWDLSALPSLTRTDLRVLGIYLWSQLEPNEPNRFLQNITRPLRTYPIPPALVTAILGALSQAASARTGLQIQFTSEEILGLTPLAFVQMLRDWRLLSFRITPEQIADSQLAAQPPG